MFLQHPFLFKRNWDVSRTKSAEVAMNWSGISWSDTSTVGSNSPIESSSSSQTAVKNSHKEPQILKYVSIVIYNTATFRKVWVATFFGTSKMIQQQQKCRHQIDLKVSEFPRNSSFQSWQTSLEIELHMQYIPFNLFVLSPLVFTMLKNNHL